MKVLAGLGYGIAIVLSVGFVAGELVLTSPFRNQTNADIELGFFLSQWAARVSLAALLVGILLAVAIWRSASGLKTKAVVLVGFAALGLSAYMARESFAEREFAALAEIVRIPVANSTHVLPNDLVLGVKDGGVATAYPVPIIAYHHIVNDRLADEPFVVTY